MSKENFERFMKQVADSEDLQAKIGKEITGDALVALGAAHGCEFSIEDLQAGAELSDKELDDVAGGLSVDDHANATGTLQLSRKSFHFRVETEDGHS